MSRARKLTPDERLALCHKVAGGIPPISATAERVLALWDDYWRAEAPDARPVAAEDTPDPTLAFDHRRRGVKLASINTTVVARDEDGNEATLGERLTRHGVITTRSGASTAWRAQEEPLDRLHAAEFVSAYHKALTVVPAWARDLLDLEAAGKSPAEIAAAIGLPVWTARRQLAKAHRALADAVVPSRGLPE